MKKIAMRITLLTLTLALLAMQVALAEPDAAVKGVYDALLGEGSSYAESKAMYIEYFPGCAYEEILNDDSFTITISGSEYADGSWTFTREGDNLTTTVGKDDMGAISMVLFLVDAVSDYLGMDSAVANGYVNGLGVLDIEDDCFTMNEDADADTITVSINIAAPWKMEHLDQMVLDEYVMDFDPLGGEYTSMAASVGKVMMVANGEPDDATILLGEYGGLDDVAYQSLINAVSVLKPNGWEDFVANYTEFADVEAAGYTVTLNADAEAVDAIIDDAHDSYSYAVIHFGA